MAGNFAKLMIAMGFKIDESKLNALSTKINGIVGKVGAAGEKLTEIGRKTQAVGRKLSLAVGLPVIGAGLAVAKFAGDFDAQMKTVEAKSGAVGEELSALREKAIVLGSSTQFTASEAAGAMIEFSKAGLKANQILNIIGPALDFAAANGIGLSETAKIMADTMSQFGLEATDAVSISDILSKAADSATTNIEEMSEAMSYSGSTAKAMGITLEETGAILAAMASTGIKASRAGTAFSSGLIRLANPSKEALATFKKLKINLREYVSDTGKMIRPVKDLFKALNTAGATLPDIIGIFDLIAGRSLIGIINDTSKLADATDALSQSQGHAAKQAAVQMAGFNGAVKAFKSALEGLAIRIGESGVLEFFEGAVKFATKLTSAISDLSPRLLSIVSAVAAVAAGIAGLTTVLGTLMIVFGAVGKAGALMWLKLSWPIVGIVAAVALAIAAVILIVDDLYAFFDGRPSLTGTMLEKLKESAPELYNFLSKLFEYVSLGFKKMWEGLTTFAGYAVDGFIIIAKKLWDIWTTLVDTLYQAGKTLAGGFKQVFSALGFNFDKDAEITPTIGNTKGKMPNFGGSSNVSENVSPLGKLLGGKDQERGMSIIGQPALSQTLASNITNTRNNTNNTSSNQVKQTINAPINISISGSASPAEAKTVADMLRRELGNITQSAAKSSRPVYAQ